MEVLYGLLMRFFDVCRSASSVSALRTGQPLGKKLFPQRATSDEDNIAIVAFGLENTSCVCKHSARPID